MILIESDAKILQKSQINSLEFQNSSHPKLIYQKDRKPLMSYTDLDEASDPNTRRTISGYIYNVESCTISWSSKFQLIMSLSTCKAEYG